MIRSRIVPGLLLVLLFTAGARAEEPRPRIQNLRFNEDWSAFGHFQVSREEPRSVLDQLKWIPLSDDESVTISFGGQLRERVEAWSNFNFGTTAGDTNDDIYLLSRVRYHADLRAADRFRVFVEGKHAFSTARDLPGGRRTVDVDEADLLNAFAEYSAPFDTSRVTFRVGRQELLFGRQRLVSPLDWSNVRRTFDGLSTIVQTGGWKLHGFWTRPVAVRKYEFNKNDANNDFFGIDATRDVTVPTLGPSKLNTYWYGFYRDNATFGSATGSEKRHTLGILLHNLASGNAFTYEVESGLQVGRVGDARIRAWMATAELAYTVFDAPMTPRFAIGADYASGGRNTQDGTVSTFNHLFPLGHTWLGYIDVVARQNIIDLRPSVTLRPTDKLTMRFEPHFFWRADTDDALYLPSGAVLRPGDAGSSAAIGTELDFIALYQATRHLNFVLGLSQFTAGRFIEQSGPSEEIFFGYFSAQWTF